jgi:hypothetical protein
MGLFTPLSPRFKTCVYTMVVLTSLWPGIPKLSAGRSCPPPLDPLPPGEGKEKTVERPFPMTEQSFLSDSVSTFVGRWLIVYAVVAEGGLCSNASPAVVFFSVWGRSCVADYSSSLCQIHEGIASSMMKPLLLFFEITRSALFCRTHLVSTAILNSSAVFWTPVSDGVTKIMDVCGCATRSAGSPPACPKGPSPE